MRLKARTYQILTLMAVRLGGVLVGTFLLFFFALFAFFAVKINPRPYHSNCRGIDFIQRRWWKGTPSIVMSSWMVT